jgi:hypothetical protein
MQVGPSLHRCSRSPWARRSRGVRRMASEDSGLLHSMHPSIPASSVHGDGKLPDGSEPLLLEMFAPRQRLHDGGEGHELLLLCAQERMSFEERNDPGKKIIPVADDVHQGGVGRSAVVRLYPSTAKPTLDQVENLTTLGVLTDVELRNELPTGSRRRVPLNGDVKRTFSVDVARNVGIQPFLLIDRTRCVVTFHAPTLAVAGDVVSSSGYTVFPAFSRIY